MADVLFAVLAAAVLAFTAGRFASEGRDWIFDVATGVAVSGTVLARRRHPLAAPITGLAVGAIAAAVSMTAGLPSEPGAAAILALAVLAATAVRSLPAVPAAAIGAGGVGVAGAGRLGAALGYQTSHAAYMFGAETWLAAVAFGLWLRYLDRRRRNAAEWVRRDERLAMARELHDVVAHHITGIVLQTQAARIAARRSRGSDERHGDGLDGALEEIEAAGSQALTAMRRVVALLRDADDAASTDSAPESLTDLVERFAGHGPAVTLTLPGPESDLEETRWPPEIASTVYRVVQESLTNIARHAIAARSVSVAIARCAEGIRIEVADDAPTASSRPLHRSGFGLIGMRERVEALGGTLQAGPRPGAGWAVTAMVPVESPGSTAAAPSIARLNRSPSTPPDHSPTAPPGLAPIATALPGAPR